MSTQFRPPNMALTTVGLSLATFMQVLDTTIANVSLPTIAGNLGVSVNQSTWVITSFAVSMAISLPLTGFLTRRFGEVKMFIWSTLLFSLASFLCGIAQSMGMLILFRAIQGAVAGPMYPVTQALLISIYPPAKRGMALALLAFGLWLRLGRLGKSKLRALLFVPISFIVYFAHTFGWGTLGLLWGRSLGLTVQR